MTGPLFVDTNVLVYARDRSAGDARERAATWLSYLWRTRTGRLSFQVLQEYYVTVTSKLKPGLPRADARADVQDLMTWIPRAVDGTTLETAWAIEDRFGLGFWDALVVASARAAGCRYLLTEDLQDGQDLDGLVVLNPFRVEPPAAG